MGWTTERTNARGQVRHYAIYRDIQGRIRSAGTFNTRAKAEKAWQRAEAQQDLGRAGDPKRGRQRLEHYVRVEWLPHHQIEASTRESYVYLLDRYILPELGGIPMRELLPSDVRAWVLKLQDDGVRAPTIKNCKIVLGAILTTALNDQVTSLHAGRGVKTPPVPRKPIRIITAEQFERIHDSLEHPTMQLLVETDIESGLRWGELTELRPRDLDAQTGILTISRAVVHLRSKSTPDEQRFTIKRYPKEGKWREVKLAPHILTKLLAHIEAERLGTDDLLFSMPDISASRRRQRPEVLPDPLTLGFTEPNEKGTRYRHGTKTAYQAAKCRCQHCRDAIADYRAERRRQGKDAPRRPRSVRTDGHIPNDWFRTMVWTPALDKAGLGFRVTPHGLRHAHASWLLNGGADLVVVKERLGHGSISTTERYLHTLPGAHDAALAAMDNIRRPGSGIAESGEARPITPTSGTPHELQALRETVERLTAALTQLGLAAGVGAASGS